MIYFLYLLNQSSSFDVVSIQLPLIFSPGSAYASRDYNCKDTVCIVLQCKQYPRNTKDPMSEVLLAKFLDSG